jgi:predicted permease
LAGLRLWQGGEAATRQTFHFSCGVNNYTFLPIMLARPLWGDEAVALIAFGALGAELFLWTLGIRALSGRSDLKQLLSAPLVALSCATVFLLLRRVLPLDAAPDFVCETGKMALSTLKTAGEATIPVSALVCGARMGTLTLRGNLTPPAWIFTGLRLLLIPALCVALLLVLPLEPEVRRVLFLIAVQPVAMAAVPMSEVYGGDPAFAATAVFLTHALCLVSIPLWMSVLIH